MSEICFKLKRHYRELDEKLSKWKEELGCEPLCEYRYSHIRDMSITLSVLYELIRALCD